MKVLIIRPIANVVNRNTYNLQEEGIAKEYIKMGLKCSLVFFTNGKYHVEHVRTAYGDIDIYWIPGFKIYDNALFYSRYINPLIEDADVVVTEEYEQLFSCLLAIRNPKKTLVYHGPYDCSYKSRYKIKSKIFDTIFLRRMLSKQVRFVTKSRKAQNTIIAKGFENVKVIPVGLDFSKFIEEDYTKGFKISGIGKELSILYIGALEDRRNIPFMIHIMKYLNDKKIPAKLTIIGSGNRDYVENCKKLICQMGLERNITIEGKKNQSELANVYRTHNIFILPSKYEIFGMVLLEAMLFGRIVLSSDNGGSDALINNGFNGFILGIGDAKEWADKIEEIYSGKYNVSEISENAHESVVNNGSWENSAKKFADIFKEMSGNV